MISLINPNANFLHQTATDGEIYDAWRGVNEVIVQYGSAEISQSFFKALENCARDGWKHWGYFNFQEPGSSCLYKVYRLRGKYFIELQSAKMHCKARDLVIQFFKAKQGYDVSVIGTAAGQATPAQVVTIQRLDEIFVRMGSQIAIQSFLSNVSLSFKLVEENESEFDGIPMLYELAPSE